MRESDAPNATKAKNSAQPQAVGDEVNVRCPCGSGKWYRDCHGK
ncbi:SEC-C domain-containing protein (plasmid) [Nocardiopsis flavescens]|nr:SEC-C domain-containing protein [Nocardiopsis flavescens]QKW32592.1 SEC-C domain-containing protein [Nocardiopsis flavescens]